MKNTILIVLLFAGVLLADWPVHNTTINLSNANSFDVFTNKNGNHIIVQENNILKYYKMNTSGSYSSPITIENTSVVSPSITGDNNKLFIVYRISSETTIKVKTSTDGGSTWNYLSTSPTNSNADNIESVYSKNYLHVTFSVSNTAYHTYYYNNSWIYRVQISDANQGRYPRIVSWTGNNENKVYFTFSKDNYEGKWREWNAANNGYSSINQAYYQISQAALEGMAVNEDYVFTYYYYSVRGSDYLRYDRRSKSDNSSSLGDGWGTTINRIYSTTTADNSIYTSFYNPWNLGETLLDPPLNQEENSFFPGLYLIDASNAWGNSDLIKAFPGDGMPTEINLSSAGNECHVIWKDVATNYLDYAFKDLSPCAPANLAGSLYYTTDCSYPCLTWEFNSEPDVYANSSAYYIERRINGGAWSHISTQSGNANSFIDWDISWAGSGRNTAEYMIKAIDLNGNSSSFTNSVSIHYGNVWKLKGQTNNNITEYKLGNYPNPFNPITTINYDIPVPGIVHLNIYDALGREILKLVNEMKDIGSYNVQFDASKLTSGVYFYRINVNDFVMTKKMIVTK